MNATPRATADRTTLAGKVVLITGAGGTLGRASVAACRAAGARLVLVDRDRDALGAALRDTDHGDALLLGVDLRRLDETQAAFDRARERFGGIDAVLHLAGGFRGVAKVHETSEETFHELLEMNLHTTFAVASAAVPHLLERGDGALLFIGARAGQRAPGGLAAYSASKSGVLRVTESLAEELQGTGVRVNCLVPSAIAPAGSSGADGTPADAIADVLVFLASDAGRAVRGAIVAV